MTTGKKYDAGKDRFDLIDDWAEREFARALTWGATKYGDDNWREVSELQNRYFAALRRHINSRRRGEVYDKETGLHHLAHAMACLHFMLAADIQDHGADEDEYLARLRALAAAKANEGV